MKRAPGLSNAALTVGVALAGCGAGFPAPTPADAAAATDVQVATPDPSSAAKTTGANAPTLSPCDGNVATADAPAPERPVPPRDTAAAYDAPSTEASPAIGMPGSYTAPATRPAPWYSEEFRLRRRIALPAGFTPGDVRETPALLAIAAGALMGAAADGADVRLCDWSGKLLAHEVETFGADGAAAIWVGITDVAAAARDGLYVYYAARQPPPPVPPDHAAAVWGPAFAAVWHFAGNPKDATAHHFDPTDVKAGFDASGRIGPALRLDSSVPQYLRLHQVPIISGASGVTLSAWVRHAAPVRSNQDIVIGIGVADKTGHLSRASFAIAPQMAVIAEVNPNEDRYYQLVSAKGSMPDGEWHHLTEVFDVANRTMAIYKDGVLLARPMTAGAWTSSAFPATPSDRVTIGGEEDVSHGFYNGLIDELRVETVARRPSEVAVATAATTPGFLALGPVESH
jgi:hypothetical protein